MSKYFEADDSSIGELLFNDKVKLKIPRFQRPYSWGKEESEDYWNDLVSDDGLPFIGSVVLNSENTETDGYLEVIDGQQRLLTTTIFMSALRDVAAEVGLQDLSDRIQRKTIAVEDRKGRETYRIKCGDSLNDFFEKNIQAVAVAKKDKKPTDEHKKVIANYELFKDKILGYVSKVDLKTEKTHAVDELWDMVDTLNIIKIVISSDDDAYTVFETVNARGVDLTVADLLKNWIFKQVGTDIKGVAKAKSRWAEIESNVSQVDVEISTFVRHFWLSKYSFVQERNLYRTIKKDIDNFDEFLEDLRDASEWYHKLLSFNKNDWRDIDNGVHIYNSLVGLHAMRVKQANVLFLCLMRNKDRIPFRLDKYFKLIEDFTFCYSAIGKLQANRVEKLYSAFSTNLEDTLNSKTSNKNMDKNVNRVFSQFEKDLKDLVPNKEFFIEKFMDIEYKNSSSTRLLIRYILRNVETYHTNKELKIDFDNSNIEHILPQKANLKEWGMSKDDFSEQINKLGNLVILSEELNSSAGNSGLEIKLDILGKTKIQTTKELVKKIKRTKKWGRDEIIKRQRNLAEVAFDKIWTL